MSSYQDWIRQVTGIVAGHGFLHPSEHVATVDAYTREAHARGMTAVRCANNIVKAHQEGRALASTGRGGPGTEPCGSCDPCRQCSPRDCWSPRMVQR